jgi:phosphoribosylaminoimidazolecarboxamide formyltransferase/IMP cyclohydrolase
LKEKGPVRIAVLASGGGSNLQAIMDACSSGRIGGEVSLVVSSLGKAGSLERAARAGIRAEALPLKNSASPAAHDAALTELCRGADLVCLAGWMLKLGPEFLSAFKGRILNIHPALLPAFGGKGFYGKKVHEAVIAAGVRLSGCTVHFVTEDYDSGPIIVQRSVPVFPDDTPAALASRVNAAELDAYPAAVSLFCDGLLELEEGRVLIKRAPGDGRVRRALVSLSDKTGAVDFARALAARGVEVVSTSGTYKLLKEAGLPVRPLESLTGFPEILDGRVKTLQPAVHGGILYRRDRAAHAEELFRHGIEPIDIVAVNLYPFEKTAARARAWSDELIEDIDIGGVALLRASAKNCASVTVLTDPADYPRVLDALDANAGKVPEALNRELAVKAFELTSSYDAAIAGKLGGEPLSCGFFPARLRTPLNKICDLRYGENPHQRAALYSRNPGLPFEKLGGKDLSYNNILDAYGTWQAVNEFEVPACVIFKHVTPCGLGIGSNIREAFERAWSTDPLSAFGGIIAVNRTFDRGMAEFLSKKFVEVVCAPGFEEEAVRLFAKKPNLRLLKWEQLSKGRLMFRSLGDEVLISEDDERLLGDRWEVPTVKKPTKAEEEALRLAWAACKYVRSNAIVLSDRHRTVAIGAGQMSRVDSVFMAGRKLGLYLKDNPKPEVMVMASDAFFPFPDALEEGVRLGATAVIQPGGSVKDAEVIAAADRLGVAMVLTGMRHFRH